MRFIIAIVGFGVALSMSAVASTLPDLHISSFQTGSATAIATDGGQPAVDAPAILNGTQAPASSLAAIDPADRNTAAVPDAPLTAPPAAAGSKVPVDANGNPIPLERRQPQRILGFMPNFRSVSGGAAPPPPGWKYNFTVATHQAMDYSTFLFLGLTSITAEGMDMHPALGKGVDGFYAYTWRGFLDKTDNTYLSAWLLPSLLHEDTRFYALGAGHSIVMRSLYVISRQGVGRTYGGHDTPNIAGIGGKVGAQAVSRLYYPASASSFPVLATKFGYSVMRDVIFSSIREFYPDTAAHFVRKHREKMAAREALKDTPTQATR